MSAARPSWISILRLSGRAGVAVLASLDSVQASHHRVPVLEPYKATVHLAVCQHLARLILTLVAIPTNNVEQIRGHCSKKVGSQQIACDPTRPSAGKKSAGLTELPAVKSNARRSAGERLVFKVLRGFAPALDRCPLGLNLYRDCRAFVVA